MPPRMHPAPAFAFIRDIRAIRGPCCSSRVFQSGPAGAVTQKQVYFTFDNLDRLTVINRGEYDPQTGWHSVVLDTTLA